MGLLLGLTLGCGLVLVMMALTAPADTVRRSRRPGVRGRLDAHLRAAGVESVTPAQLLGLSAGSALLVGITFLALTKGTVSVALAFAVMAGYAPVALVKARARRRRQELRELWPDVVDNLASAVRAGLSLPEALSQLAVRGPEPTRRPFEQFAEDYRATGRFHDCLDALKERLADPTGDRIVESVRMAREVGGSDLGRLLRTLSTFLRDDLRTRAEIETRQGWVVNAARLAVAAPWVMLALLATRGTSVAAYDQPAGWFVLLVGAGLCVVAYRLMLRLGKLPDDARVLR